MIDDYSISKLEPFFIMDITYKTQLVYHENKEDLVDEEDKNSNSEREENLW
jgi:hypothetical protein